MSTRSDTSRFTDPHAAIDHVHRVARETEADSGYAAATALLALYGEYRVTPFLPEGSASAPAADP